METMAQAEAQASVSGVGPSTAPDGGEAEDTKPIHTEIPSDGIDIPDTSSELSEPPSPSLAAVKTEDEERPTKKKRMTLEEYEAMLDAEDGEGGFMEGGDIPSSDI